MFRRVSWKPRMFAHRHVRQRIAMYKKLIQVPDYHLVGDRNGNWKKVPGRLALAMELAAHGKAELEAKAIATSATRLTGYKVASIERRLADFIQSYLDFFEYLHTSLGDIPIKADSARVRNLWHTYLLRGRELIDELGKVVHTCFGIKQEVGGINEKKLTSLRKNIDHASRNIGGLGLLVACLDKHEQLLVTFIALRNRDKTDNDTLIDLPWISETGTPSGGIVGDPAKQFRGDFVTFTETSYASIMDFTKTILGAQ